MNFYPFDLHNEISLYFEQWAEFVQDEYELEQELALSKPRLTKLVEFIVNHPQASKIYNDFELWFTGKSVREDVMSDTFTEILDQAFEELFSRQLKVAE